MRSKFLTSAVRALSLLLLVSATCALAQERRPVHFSGLFNDYSPTNPAITGSPWEMHGQWSMDVNLERGTADFAGDMTMSGYGMTAAGTPDAIQGGQAAHTHHLKLTNKKITWGIAGCPVYAKPVPTEGFQITGTVSLITGNGGPAPFETTPPIIDPAGLRPRWKRSPVLERYAGLRRSCSAETLRVAAHPWRRAYPTNRTVRATQMVNDQAGRCCLRNK